MERSKAPQLGAPKESSCSRREELKIGARPHPIASSGISPTIGYFANADCKQPVCLLRLEIASEMEVPGNDTNFYYEILGVGKEASEAELKKA